MARQMVDVYAEFAHNTAAMPVIAGKTLLPRLCLILSAQHCPPRLRSSCQAAVMILIYFASAGCSQRYCGIQCRQEVANRVLCWCQHNIYH